MLKQADSSFSDFLQSIANQIIRSEIARMWTQLFSQENGGLISWITKGLQQGIANGVANGVAGQNNASSFGVATQPQVKLNITNNSSIPIQQSDISTSFDGRAFVQNVVLEDLGSRGPIFQTMRGGI